VLKVAGTLGASLVGTAATAGSVSADITRTEGDGYERWSVSGGTVYDLSDGETLENVVIDQTADGASLCLRSRNKTEWTVRNVGFVGSGEAGDGSNRFQFQVSTSDGGTGVIENVWASGKKRGDQPASKLGGIYVRSSHAGHIDVRHTYIEGFGNNAVYGSAVGKDGGKEGSVGLENCYHRDNTVSQYRIGSPDSFVRNCVGVVDDPDGDRGAYPSGGSRNARGIWAKHFPDQLVENCAFYVSAEDIQPDSAFETRYIGNRSRGETAVLTVRDCTVNVDVPSVRSSTANASVAISSLSADPTVDVIGNGGVPTSPEMAAAGKREMPPELPD
jgi:hypothetical protein